MKKLLRLTTKIFVLYMVAGMVITSLNSCEEKDKHVWEDGEAPTLLSIFPSQAKVGDEVSITGKYFSPKAQNTVSFNGIEASIVSANLTEIIAEVPSGATSGEVSLLSDGEAATNTLSFTVVQPITPSLASIDPDHGKVGDEVLLTGTNFSIVPEENIVKFNGVQATVLESTATTIKVQVPVGATTGNITVTRDNESNGILFTVSASTTFSIQITESIDDVEEASSTGMIDAGSSDLELGEFDTTGDPDYGLQTIGLRFRGITVPAGATILSANIQFTCDDTGSDLVQLTIFGEDAGNPPVFDEATQYTVTGRTKTTENVVWDISEWLNEGDAGTAQQTPDLASIVQALVNRADWATGNSMVFIMEHSGPSIGVTSNSGGREAETADGSESGTLAPVLTIVYE